MVIFEFKEKLKNSNSAMKKYQQLQKYKKYIAI